MNLIPDVEVHRPKSLEEALKHMEAPGAKPLAGGTDLIIDLREGACEARNLVDLTKVKELDYIREFGGRIRIGAMTHHTDLVASDLIRTKAQVLSEAANLVGSIQIRNLGTVGGNICNASPGADTATPLLALGAEATISSSGGVRVIPLGEFFAGPKRTSLNPGELLTELSFPTPPAGSGGAFQKLGRRKGCTLSLINIAAYVELDGDTCSEVRVAVGACAPTPVRITDVEEMLKGKKIDEAVIGEVSSACYGLVQPSQRAHSRASEEYRREMSCVLMRRALTTALERARGNK
ncbi:xanthine dehydrogenase family protein subunit M [Candidatus Bathyarchaeota archaeon]|nr:xanthine dehydrogenase family protein subunit M [Candidatus Bathyarchaeota archaeon]MBL7168338.1 xanthine dehydrogenase family protein subunit M [Candidatus Bathyarchaeota archaeon]